MYDRCPRPTFPCQAAVLGTVKDRLCDQRGFLVGSCGLWTWPCENVCPYLANLDMFGSTSTFSGTRSTSHDTNPISKHNGTLMLEIWTSRIIFQASEFNHISSIRVPDTLDTAGQTRIVVFVAEVPRRRKQRRTSHRHTTPQHVHDWLINAYKLTINSKQ